MMISKLYNYINKWLMNTHFGKKGKRTTIKKPLLLSGKRNIFLGSDVRILNNARIETVDFWKNQKFTPCLKIGDRTTIEQNCHIVACGDLLIGEDCVFSADVYVSDCNHGLEMGKNVLQNSLEYKHTSIGNGCFLGIGVKVLPGVTLGNYCVVGANSVVTKSFPSYSMVVGNPARLIKIYDVENKKWVKI